MNVTVYHDDGGNIVAVAARSDDAPPEYMGSRLPLRAVDVEESALTTDLEAAEICKRLAELKSSRRVDIDTGMRRLVDRES